jgi:hypothetical protein
VGSNGTRVYATAVVRSNVPAGSAFLAEGLRADSANALTESLIEVHKVGDPALASSANGGGGQT